MNFFKSILLDDPDPPKPENPHEPGPSSPSKRLGKIGIRATTLRETEVIREAASRAVKDLPASLEAGTSALDGVLKSTAEIISKETRQVFASDGEPDTPETNRSLNSGRYSWFEAQLSGIQSDLYTFCEEPEDVEEYKKWKLRFELEDKRDEIEGLIGENGTLEGVYEKVVPSAVDHETFWFDDDDDELSWDVDDDEEKDGNGDEAMSGKKVDGVEITKEQWGCVLDEKEVKSDEVALKSNEKVKSEESGNEKDDEHEKVKSDVSIQDKNDENEQVKSDEIVKKESNKDVGESGEKSDVPVVVNHQAKMEEEELEWDEIEDIGSGDEGKIVTAAHGERPNRAELRKQLNAAEDDEDLSWDIEDDDETVKP
ncbi:UNVERIFIED_CONTAM: hypothetical protein Sradi_0460100 [Sesamum radiatum]|uniref:BSD domain-containing protein n=1 Tax=Sesamum radiatum TaxID=300843 RepID=A0AAW2WBA2_SESRA